MAEKEGRISEEGSAGRDIAEQGPWVKGSGAEISDQPARERTSTGCVALGCDCHRLWQLWALTHFLLITCALEEAKRSSDLCCASYKQGSRSVCFHFSPGNVLDSRNKEAGNPAEEKLCCDD